ncbi:hypothetical protein EDB19DRAFT_1723263 [Suillus lakei]|nr:hypothetical protein EDB19DRAFT_1723263 [Suillus lakei]
MTKTVWRTMSTTNEVKVPFFKKGKYRPSTSRKRSASPPPRVLAPIPSSSKSEVILPFRKTTGNLLSAGTKRTAAQRREDEMDNPDAWTAAGSHTNAALEILAGDEAAELLAKRQKKEKADRGEEEEEIPDDGLYRGHSAYRSHLKKSQEIPKAMRVETGYCGFGDTCKFLHDRGTYLAGWQLDKLAETPRKQVEDVSDSESDNEDIPFACLICRKPYTDPAGIFNRADKIIDKLNKKRAEKDDDHVEDDNPGVEIEGLVDNGSRDSDSGDDDDD